MNAKPESPSRPLFPDGELPPLRRKILAWFARHGRDLPWRRTHDPYAVWVSEIMLQQTTTETVAGYFAPFLRRFPTVRALAEADIAEVLRCWEGLGYYRRAHLLHRAAGQIVEKYGGVFPAERRQAEKLPGFGRYTTGAVLSFALGSPNTPFGKLRRENGHSKPYDIRFWGIGNEMYGDWQIGHMPVEEYVKKNNLFADAFHAAYPHLFLIGVGNVGGWDDVFIPGAIGHIEAISEHFYTHKKKEIIPRVQQVAYEIKRISDAHDQYRARWQDLYAQSPLPVAMDEWNYAGGKLFFGLAGIRFNLLDGLGVAEGLHQFFRRSDLYVMANYAQTINVLGAIKATPAGVQLESTGLVLALYRKVFGTIPVFARVGDERFDIPGSGIDVSAALTEEGKFLTVAMVNPFAESKEVFLDLGETPIYEKGRVWRMTDRENDPQAYNDPESEQRIAISEEPVSLGKRTVTLPPYSVSIFQIKIRR